MKLGRPTAFADRNAWNDPIFFVIFPPNNTRQGYVSRISSNWRVTFFSHSFSRTHPAHGHEEERTHATHSRTHAARGHEKTLYQQWLNCATTATL
jgi:hypothetical protein